MSSPTSSDNRYDRTDDRPGPRSDDPIVLSPDDYTVIDVRGAADVIDPSVQRVTAARGSHTENVGRRMRNYAFSMGIRTLCVIAFVVAFPHWSAWLFVPGAVLLPYVAVILANTGNERAPSAVAGVPTGPDNLPVLPTYGPA